MVKAFAHGVMGRWIDLFVRLSVPQVIYYVAYFINMGARCSSVVRVFAHGSILHGGPIELFLIPASAPQLV